MNRTIVTPPAAEALTAAEVQTYLKQYDDEVADQAALIAIWITAARQAAEGSLLRPMLPQTCRATFDDFSPRMPLWNDVTEIASVTYLDGSGVRQTLDSSQYRLKDMAYLAPATSWPTGTEVEVEFTAGAWGDADNVPASIKAWMLLHIGGLDAYRGSMVDVQTYALPAAVTEAYIAPHSKPAL